ncbi:putative NADP-dependent oxidoreductase YfmJ [compost metagenome]
MGLNGWETYSIAEGGALAKIDNAFADPEQYYLSIFGPVGLTAYFALLEVGLPKVGETLLVSAAAGAVGSLVGQIGKIKGCRVVGLAGSEQKCRWLCDELGFDAAINYREVADVSAAIASTCPDGVDIYFDNVGGAILDAALLHINDRARIVFCGAISGYNSTVPVPGPYNLWQILAHSARLEGFLIRDYFPRFGEGAAQMREWLLEGQIQFREQLVDGLDNCLPAFASLFDGSNTGKVVVRL